MKVRAHSTWPFVALAVCLLAAMPAHAAFQIAIEGDAGNYIVDAQSLSFDDSDGTLIIERPPAQEFDQGYRLRFQENTDQGAWFDFEFAAADNQPLTVGPVTGAEGHAYRDAGAPLLDVSGNGKGCNEGSGEFEIREITESPDGSTLLQFAVDLTFYCEGLGAPLRASIRIDSSLPPWDGAPATNAGEDQLVAPAGVVQLNGSASTAVDGSPLTYQWTQVRGTAVVLTGAATAFPTFTAPVLDAHEYEFLEFRLVTTDTSMRSSADSVIVTVSESPTQQTLFNADYGDGYLSGPARTVAGPLDAAGIRWGYGYPNSLWLTYTAQPGDPTPERKDFGVTMGVPFPKRFGAGIYYVGSRLPGGTSFAELSYSEESSGCSANRGSYVVREAAFEPNGVLDRLAVDFLHRCEDLDPVQMTGILRFNSTVPVTSRAPTAAPGPDRIAFSGDAVNLDAGYSTGGLTPIAGYSWQQASGQTVALAGPDTDAPSFVAPVVDPGTGDMSFDLTVTNDAGYTDTGSVNVTVLGPDDPKNYARLFADPVNFDFIMWGEDRFFTDNDAIFSANPAESPEGTRDGVTLDMDTNFEGTWSIEVAPPTGTTLVPGVYPNFSSFPEDITRPYVRFSGNGRGCNDGTGDVIVHELARRADGTIDRLAIDFTQACADLPPTTVSTGIIRYNSTIPDVAPDPIASIAGDGTVISGSVVSLDSGGSYAGPTGIATVSWQQIGGPPVTLTDPNAPTLTFTPDVTGTGPVDLQFKVTITTNDGRVSTTTHTVTVIPEGVPYSAIDIESEPGDPIGEGRNVHLDVDDLEFRSISNSTNDVNILADGAEHWDLQFQAPNGEPLTPGNYELAVRPNSNAGFPGIDVSAHHLACLFSTGRFVVYEVSWRPDGSPESLAVDFEQHCDFRDAVLRGALRFNSAIPLRPPEPNAAAGRDLVAAERSTVHLNGLNSSDADGQIVAYAWSQISGPVVALDDPTSPTPSFVAPEIAQDTAVAEFELSVRDDDGNSDADTVGVTILDDLAPRNIAYLHEGVRPFPYLQGDVVLNDNNSYFGDIKIVRNAIDVYVETLVNIHFEFDFYGPNDTLIEEGRHYTHTPTSRDAGGAHADIYLDTPCEYSGWFDVLQVQTLGDRLQSLAVDYEQQCADWVPPVVGSIRFNSAVPVRTSFVAAYAGGDDPITEGTSHTLDARESFSTDSDIAHYRWQVTDGPDVVFSGEGPTPTFVAPAVPAAASPALLTIVLEAEDEGGMSDTDDIVFSVQDNGITGFPDDMLTMSPTNGLPLGVSVDGGDLVYNEAQLPTSGGDVDADPGQETPFGVWLLRVLAASGSATLNLYTPAQFGDGSRWTANSPAMGWRTFEGTQTVSADGKTMHIELVDGSTDDLDGTVNGTVEIQGGIGVFSTGPSTSPPPTQPPPSGGSGNSGGGGGGSSDPLLLLVLTTFLSVRRWAMRARRPTCATASLQEPAPSH